MKKFFNWLDNTFIKPVEKSKISLGTFILIAYGYTVVRNITEGVMETSGTGNTVTTILTIEMLFLHYSLFYFVMYLAIALLMRLVAGIDFRKTIRVLLVYSFIIMIPPLVDPLFRSGGFNLAYPGDPAMVINGIKAILQPWLIFSSWGEVVVPYGTSPGMLVEIYLAVLLVAIYGGLRARTTRRKIISILLTPIIMAVAAVVTGGTQQIMGLLPGDPSSTQSLYFLGGLINSSTRKYALVLLFPFTPMLWLGLFLYSKEKTRLLIRSLDPVIMIISAFAAGAGFLFAWLGLRDLLVGVPRNPFDYLALIALFILGAASAAVHLFLSRGHDSERSEADRKTFRRAAGGMFVLATAFAWCLGYPTLFVYVCFLVVTLVLTIPPLRLQRYFVPSVLLNTLAVFLLVFCGYSLFGAERAALIFPWQLALVIFASLAMVFLGREIILRRAKQSPKEVEK